MCAPSSGAGGAGPPPPWSDPEGMAVAPDGKTKAVATPGGTIQFQDVATGRREEFRGPPEQVTALVFGPEGRVFTGSPDETVLAWDLRAAKLPPADLK